MCFLATKEATRRVRDGKQRIFYKVVSNPDRRSPHRTYSFTLTYAVGEVIEASGVNLDEHRKGFNARKWRTKRGKGVGVTMFGGIYVYKTRRGAEAAIKGWQRAHRMVIEVEADPRDVIGAGLGPVWGRSLAMACFTKVKVLT